MIVVVEGPDGSGKSTLAERLRAELGATVHHDRYDPKQWIFTTTRLLEALEVHRRGGLAVLDRCWIGEQVYGPIFRGPDVPTWGRAHDRVLLRHGCLYVFCLPVDRARYLAEYERLRVERPERYVSMGRVYDAYRQLVFGFERPTDEAPASRRHLTNLAQLYGADQQSLNYGETIACAGGWLNCRAGLHYDRHGYAALDDTVALIRREWELARATRSEIEGLPAPSSPWRTAFPTLAESAAGRFSCETVLLVGEDHPHARSFDVGGRTIRPAYPFFRPDGSSAYLARALTRVGVLESELAFVNVLDFVQPGTTLPRLLQFYNAVERCRRVVALGAVARATLESLGVQPDEVVRHPQLARRFDHRGSYHLELAQAVLE